jgi:Fe-S cluster assembly protein SufD
MKAELAIDAVRAVVGNMPDDGLAPARDAALRQLDKNGLPNTKDEDWKYTDLDAVIKISNEWLAGGCSVAPVTESSVESVTAMFDLDWLIIRNGTIDADSVATLQKAGLDIGLLSEHDASPEFDAPLADLNIALLQDGLSINISADFVSERPIGILHIDSAKTDVGVSQTRVAINIEEHGRASFVEYHASSGTAAHYANGVVDILLANDARVDYVRIQDRDAVHSQTGRLKVCLNDRSQFHHAAFDFGGDLIRNDLDIQIIGRDSLASFSGLYLADNTQHIDNHTRVDHRVGPARSEQEYRGILSGNARCVWNGKAVVHSGADGTDANQANHNLLLSERSEIDAKPELEIYADDVKCSHGTTVGQLDEAALFYLQTRGLDNSSARQLLMRAFAQKIVDMSPIPSIQETISEQVAKRLARLITGAPQ